MDLNSTTVALCGEFEEKLPVLLGIFHAKSITVKTWTPNISALIFGEEATGRWKYREAQRRAIRTIPVDEFIAAHACASDLWVDRYKPKKLSDIIGHTTQLNDMIRWLQNWSREKGGKEDKEGKGRGLCISGPPGIGKTTAAHLVARACGYSVIELNASNERSASAVKKWFEEAAHSHHVGQKRLFIMDEVDGMSSGDRGGIGELARLIKTCAFPILCIANDRRPRMAPLVKACLEIRFARPTKQTIAKSIYSTVVKQTGISVTHADLEDLCERNGNDIRQILNYLQFQSSGSLATRSSPEEKGTKDALQRVDAFSATGRLFHGAGSLEDKSNLVFVDFGLVPLMVAEGYVAAAGRGNSHAYTDEMRLEHCAAAADSIGAYDVLDKAIRKTQNWSLLPSSVMMVVGAAARAHGPAPFNIFPSSLGKISKTNKHKRWLRDMRDRGRFGSTEAALDARDLLRLRLFNHTDKDSAKIIVDELLDLGLTRDDMLETLVETAFSGDEASVALDSKIKAAVSREWKKRGIDDRCATSASSAEVELEDYVSSDDEGEVDDTY